MPSQCIKWICIVRLCKSISRKILNKIVIQYIYRIQCGELGNVIVNILIKNIINYY